MTLDVICAYDVIMYRNAAFGDLQFDPPPQAASWSEDDVREYFNNGGELPERQNNTMPKNDGVLRWFVDISKWEPKGAHKGAEFQFLLGLIQEDERTQVCDALHALSSDCTENWTE